jgi:ketosteroid isomerase-like protein
METRLEVEQLLSEWAWCIDEGRAAAAAALFCADAEQSLLGNRSVGIAEITAAFERRQAMVQRTSQHTISNLRIQESTPELVRAQWVLTLFRSNETTRDATPFLVAVGQDSYRRQADGSLKVWRRDVLPRFGQGA